MTPRPILRVGAYFLGFRVLLGAFYVAAEASSPGEGGMIVLTDLPALVLEYVSSVVFHWPDSVVGAYDVTFHVFGLIAWFLLGIVVGWIALRVEERQARKVG